MKVVPIGIIAVLVFALAPVRTCLAMGPIGPSIGPMGGTAPFVRASPWAGDVPGEPQGQNNPGAARRAQMSKTKLHFDLTQCSQMEAGLYKCTATDKPICKPEYSGQAECVRLGPHDNVYVWNLFVN